MREHRSSHRKDDAALALHLQDVDPAAAPEVVDRVEPEREAVVERQQPASLDVKCLPGQIAPVSATARGIDQQGSQARRAQHPLERGAGKRGLGREADLAAVPCHAALAHEDRPAGSHFEPALRPDLEEGARLRSGEGDRGGSPRGFVKSRLESRLLGRRNLACRRLQRGRGVRERPASARSVAPRPTQRLFDLRDPSPRARHTEVLERKPELTAQLVQEAEIQVAAQVPRRKLDRRPQLLLGLGKPPGLEEDQAEVGPEDLGRGVFSEEGSRRVRSLVVAPALELEKRNQVEDVLVVGPQSPRLLELRPGFFETSLPHLAPRAVQVQEEQSLIHGGRFCGGARHGRSPG